MADALSDQIADELGTIAFSLGAVLGLDVEDMVRSRAEAYAPMLAVQLTQDDDDRLSAQTVLDLMAVLWRHGDPDTLDPDWWRTPLGHAVARSVGRNDAESVSHSVAAAMLGVKRGTVSTMVSRGTLDRHPDGGVLRSSVLQRLAR